MSGGPKSKYALLFENVSSITTRRDLRDVLERKCGPVLDLAKDDRRRTALVEFKRTGDADYCYKKLHGYEMDGRKWTVLYATRADFKDFGWRWTEGGGGGASDTYYTSSTRSPPPKLYHSPSPERRASPPPYDD